MTTRSVVEELGAERLRQIHKEGWDVQHDDSHDTGQLAFAAACYAATSPLRTSSRELLGRIITKHLPDGRPGMPAALVAIAGLWPWSSRWFKPTDARRDLVKAGALIIAEIERLDRIAAKAEAEKPAVLTNAKLVGLPKPETCRMAQEAAGVPHPKSGCQFCGDGGLWGCPFEKQREMGEGTSDKVRA